MSILDDDSSSAAGGADEQSIHDFMFNDRAVDAEVVDSAAAAGGQEHAPEYVDTDTPVEKKKSTGFNMKWVMGGILAVGVIATVGQMAGGNPEAGVSEPVQAVSVNGEATAQTLPAELDEAIEAPASPGVMAGTEAKDKTAEPTNSVPAMTADPVEKIEGDTNSVLQSQVAGLEKEVGNLKEQIAGLRQLVGDRNAITSYQQKAHRPKRTSKPKVASKPQAALTVAQVTAAPVVAAASAESVRVPPAKRYTLRGIVYGQAAVERNGALLYVREGDQLGETRVASIDPVAMEVRLANGVSIK